MPQNRAALPVNPSGLILCDRLIAFAQDADRVGFVATSDRLVRLARAAFEEKRDDLMLRRMLGAPAHDIG